MITTLQLAKELGISQRAIQNRILRLGLKLSKIGNSFVLSRKQADQVRNYSRKVSLEHSQLKKGHETHDHKD